MRSIRGLLVATSLALCLSVVGANAQFPFKRGGSPSGGGTSGTAFACDVASTGVCADFANGQTFVQWPDVRSVGVSDYAKRYRVYRSTSALNSGNCTSATEIGKFILPNYGQLVGGNPDTGGSTYTQAHRQASDVDNVMAKIPDAQNGGLKTLAAYTGLHAHKATATQNAYYCVVSTTTADASPSYIGAVGPIAESAATQQAVQYAHRTAGATSIPCNDTSTTPPTQTCVSGKAVVWRVPGSASLGGPANQSTVGDYWTWWTDDTASWQEGTQHPFSLWRDAANTYPSLSAGSIVYALRDEQWLTTGATGSLVSDYWGLGLRPLNGTPNRFYPTTLTRGQQQLNWLQAHYGADLNQIHMTGESAGAIGSVLVGSNMTSPRIASVTAFHPILRWDIWPGANPLSSAGGTFWGGTAASPEPFEATVADAPFVLGNTASAIQYPDGSSWLDRANLPTRWQANPGEDMPFFMIQMSKDDDNLAISGNASFKQIVEGKNALQAAHRGHAMCWFEGVHETGATAMEAISYDDSGISGVAYKKEQFRLDQPYIAFDSSSIDDNMGTGTRDAANIMDGAHVGCINAGDTWSITTDTSGAFNFTVGSAWMTRSPTPVPTTTITGSIASSGSGSVALADATFGGKLQGTSINNYFKIGTGATAEVVFVTSVSGGNLNYANRGYLNTTARAHSAGEAVEQYVKIPTGPNGGPYSSMTVNVTPRRVQGFLKSDGYVVSCQVTPSGGGMVTKTGTVTSGLFTLTGVPINSGGPTSLVCS
jgi:hypothetical protein